MAYTSHFLLSITFFFHLFPGIHGSINQEKNDWIPINVWLISKIRFTQLIKITGQTFSELWALKTFMTFYKNCTISYIVAHPLENPLLCGSWDWLQYLSLVLKRDILRKRKSSVFLWNTLFSQHLIVTHICWLVGFNLIGWLSFHLN